MLGEGDGEGRRREEKEGRDDPGLERLSLPSADTNADVLGDFHSLWTKRIMDEEKGIGSGEEENRTKENENGMRRPRVMFSPGHVAIFPFGRGRCIAPRLDEGDGGGDCCNVTFPRAHEAL
jgi:hypothetical protein